MANFDKIKIESAGYIAVPLIAAMTSLLVCDSMRSWEMRVLGFAVGVVLPTPAVFIICAVLSAAAYACGLKLARVPRIFVLIQLSALSLLAAWLCGKNGSYLLPPTALVSSIAVGVLAGYAMRRVKTTRERHEARYFELMLRNKELAETRMQIVKSDEIERRLLAADLHDQVLNDLKALKQNIAEYSTSPSSEIKAKIDTLLDRSMSEVREVMDSLCPSALEHLGLTAALEDCLRRGAERGGFKARFKSDVQRDETDVLSPVELSLIYRLFQESVTNVIKHARASKVRATVLKHNGALVVKVVDDGKGMAQDALAKDSRGLRYMRQRADLIGASVTWRPGEDNKGVEVEIRLDLAGREHNANSDS